ncbi:methyltransferase domain-containing protein [Lachnospiraceae bacterium 50-23]
MLKAYDYAEISQEMTGLKNEGLFRREKGIALKFVLDHMDIMRQGKCPICGSSHTRFIFSRWDIDYLFCNDCCSIFVPVEEDVIKEYLAIPEMNELRISSEYQEQAEQRRSEIWEELVMWAQYRTYRYLGRNTQLDVIDYGNRYTGSVERFRNSGMCRRYELRDSILSIRTERVETADVILYMNQLQHETDPVSTLQILKGNLKENGILILNTRLGSGFDILTLKGSMDSVFPYEHIMLPSRKGLEMMLDKAGFELLEITTPGTRDMESVLRNKERIEEGNFFVKYLLRTADRSVLADFQQFLQKSGLSSFAQVVAKARKQI